MHKYYTEKSIAARWDKRLPSALSHEILKNQRRLKIHRISYYPMIEDRKTESDALPRFSYNPENHTDPYTLPSSRKKQTDSQKKIELMYKKITSLTNQKKNIIENDRIFKKSITKNMKSLEIIDVLSETEQKQVIRDYSGSTKLNLYTIKKAGIRFRTSSLRKLHTSKPKETLRLAYY